MALSRILNTAESVEIDILSEIGSGFFYEGFTMSDMRAGLLAAGERDVTINISSLGGDVNDALVIYDLLKMHKGKTTAHILGATASSGTVIAMGADYVKMSSNALFLVHNTWTGAVGNADELRAKANDLDKFDERIIDIYKKATGRRAGTIEKLMKEERWIDAAEAFEFGFIDEVFTPAKAAASALNVEQIMAEKKLPALPENYIIHQNTEEMNINEKLDEIRNKIGELILGKEKEGMKILDQPEVQDAIKEMETAIADEAQTYATEMTAKDEALASVTAEKEAIEAKLAEVEAKATEFENSLNEIQARLASIEAKATPTEHTPSVEDPQAVNNVETNPFDNAAEGLRIDVKKLNK